ncbi:hypothetical protein VIBNISOn1_1480019 [Vibrio nigripulchritudo SOn1]|uniref:Uncharacterized protein n=1 Tax=Vibrio nigripulchritudo SOn1 TaxID=1238450 RepID=A0AAV2VM36_9VIBR|nr:hypothetical protein [Vibrio nigripulchritudo]CCO45445.1 hypothetical protein VIBNISOn1_1480019 [Vibrio nigripulchritudo SOn1]
MPSNWGMLNELFIDKRQLIVTLDKTASQSEHTLDSVVQGLSNTEKAVLLYILKTGEVEKKGAQFFVEVAGGNNSQSSIQNAKKNLLQRGLLNETEYGFTCDDEHLVNAVEQDLGLMMA